MMVRWWRDKGEVATTPLLQISQADLCVAFLAHAIKWPLAVEHFLSLIKAAPPSQYTDLVRLFREVVVWSHGKRWAKIFEVMNKGHPSPPKSFR